MGPTTVIKNLEILLVFLRLSSSSFVSEYISGSNCEIGTAIRVLRREPTESERAAGCVYVKKFVPNAVAGFPA